MNKKFKSISIILSSLLFVISCSPKGTDKPVNPPTPGPTDDPESILDDFDYDPDKVVDFSNLSSYYSDHEADVETNYAVKLVANPEKSQLDQNHARRLLRNTNDIEDFLTISDAGGDSVELTHEEGEENVFYITPKNGVYKEGSVYTVELNSDDYAFKDKSPSINKMYFDTVRDDSNVYHINDNLQYFDVAKVIKFADDDTEEIADPSSDEAREYFLNHTYEMVYSTNEFKKLNAGDNFVVCPFKGGKPFIDDKLSFYGKFVSNVKDQEVYKVTYKNVNLFEIYEDKSGDTSFDVYMNEKEAEEFNDVNVLLDKEKIKEGLVHNPDLNRFVDATLIATNSTSRATKYELLQRAKVEPTFAYHAPKFVFQLKIGIYVPINEAGTSVVFVDILYQYTSVVSTSASCELKEFLGIPYWLSVTGEFKQEIDHRFNIKIGLMRNFKTEEKDTSDMKKMIRDAYDKLQNDPAYFMDRTDDEAIITNNGLIMPIASLNIPFGGIFSFYVDFEFVIRIDFSVVFEYTYINHSVQRVLSFSTSDGVENTSNSDKISASCHTLDFLGNFGLEAGLRVRVGLCITGLAKIFGLGVSFEGGFYLTLRGMAGVTWGDDLETRFVGGIDLDFGLFGSITAFLDILFFHPKYEFTKGKLSLFGYSKEYTVLSLQTPKTLQLTDPITPIEGTRLLMAEIFVSITYSPQIRSLTLNETAKIKEGNTSRYIHPVTIESDSDNLIVDADHNTLEVSESAPPTFTCKLTVKVNDALNYFFSSGPQVYTVDVTYRSKNGHNVSVANCDTTVFADQGKKITLPTLTYDTTLGAAYSCKLGYDEDHNVIATQNFTYDNTYYDFLYFTDGNRNYNPGDVLYVGDKDIVITAILDVITYYTATFYNGKGNVISTSRVREFEPAIAPTQAQIMAGMDGYVFYGWDRDFSYMTEDINVYGIYYKWGELA